MARVRSELMFIGGQWTHGSGTESIQVSNPTTEEAIATVPKGTREDAKRALDSAEEAQ